MNRFTFIAGMNTLNTPVSPGTIALVLCGGQSNRMGTDKSMLVYHDKPQRYHVYDMLHFFCEKVFISCKHSRSATIGHGYALLTDDHLYNNTGPVAALLTAFEKFPGKDILLIGCDYPFLAAAELEHFFKMIPSDKPVAFYNEEAAVFEPLLAWYPHRCYETVKQQYHAGQYSLKYFLQENESAKYIPQDKNSIRSIDTEKEYIEARGVITGKR